MATPGTRPVPVTNSRQRILRIGVLLGGKIVEERLIRERIPVTIGQSMRNTFSVPIEGLPLEFTLFALDENKYSLRFLPKMDGRLSEAGGQVSTLEQLKARAQNQGGFYQVPLSEAARGKLSFGDLTILFQFVSEPPRQPKPMLPASVRGTFADRFDPRLLVILSASIILHFAIVVIALLTDIELDNGIAERAYNLTFKQDTYTVDLTQPKVDASQTGSAAGSAAPVKAPDKAPARPKAPDKGDDGGKSKADQVALQEQEATKFADLLTGEGQNGQSEGDMSKRRPGVELGAQISEVREGGGSVKVGGGAGRVSRGDGDVRTGTGHGPNINGPGGTESAGGGKVAERAPSGRISVSERKAIDESTLTADAVLSKIQSAYMVAIKRCYTKYLTKDASARGKVALQFSVNETGRAIKGEAHGFAGEVDECINGLMQTWRFPIPKDKDGDATEAAFAIALQLVPD